MTSDDEADWQDRGDPAAVMLEVAGDRTFTVHAWNHMKEGDADRQIEADTVEVPGLDPLEVAQIGLMLQGMSMKSRVTSEGKIEIKLERSV